MSGFKCPGQDKRFWRPDDVFEAPCRFCGAKIEFWKDDAFLECEKCGNNVPNPKLNLGCAQWCKFAEQCLGAMPEGVEENKNEKPCDEAVASYTGKEKEKPHE